MNIGEKSLEEPASTILLLVEVTPTARAVLRPAVPRLWMMEVNVTSSAEDRLDRPAVKVEP